MSVIAAGAAFALALTARFAFETVAGSGVSDVGAAVLGALAAAAVVVVASGVPSTRELAALRPLDRLSIGAAGAAALLIAPLLVLAHRYSAAPSGSESLFFTTAAWGVVVFAVTATASRTSPWAGAAGAITATVGSAAMLASWEVPSSFSPFVRFAREESLMVLAALGWAVFAVALSRRAPALGRRAVLFTAAVGAAVAALLLGAVRFRDVVTAAEAWKTYVPLGLCLGIMAVAWSHLEGEIGAARAAGLFFLPAPLISALSGLEHVFMRTAQPMLLQKVAFAGALTLVGVAAMLWPPRARAQTRSAIRTFAAILSLLAAVVALVALALPSLGAEVTGRLETGETFHVAWKMIGAETAGGWIALAAASWLIWSLLGGGRSAALAGLGVLAAYPWLRDVPLRTWTRWIPAKVQQDYGTSYAHLDFTSVPAPVQGGVAVAAGVLLIGALALTWKNDRTDAAGEAARESEVPA